MSSLRARLIRRITSRYIQGINVATADVADVRRRLDKLSRLLKRAFFVSVEETTVNGLKAEWLKPRRAADGKVLLYIHGGAYVLCSCKTHRQLVSHIARAAGINALVPEYRLAPEHPFPAAIDDTAGVYRSLLAEGVSPDDIFIAGDSAGAGLTVAALLALRQAGDPMPAAVVLLSPFLDITASGESMTTRAVADPWFHAADIPIVAQHYCPDEPDLQNPLISPVFADVADLPPMLIQVGDDEILLSDSTRFAAKMKDAGREVALEIWPGMWHVFQLFVGKMPESRRAIKKIGAFLKDRMQATEQLKT